MLHVGAPHTEHAPPYTCDPFVPSPHPYSRKRAVRELSLWRGQKHTTPGWGARVVVVARRARRGRGRSVVTELREIPGCQGFLLSNKTEILGEFLDRGV